MRKVVIRDMVAEIPEDALFGGIIDIEFGNDYQIRIANNTEGWIVTNAVNGYGENCREEFVNEEVKII